MRKTPEERREQAFEEALVLASQMRDIAALESLVDRWHPRLVRIARRVTRTYEVEDLVQDIWLSVVRSLHKLRDPSLFGYWIARIARNKSVAWVRGRQSERRATSLLRQLSDEAFAHTGFGAGHGTSSPNTRVELEELRRRFDVLPEAHQIVLERFYLHDLPIAEIAADLGIPLGTVKSRLFHARRKLQAQLDKEETR